MFWGQKMLGCTNMEKGQMETKQQNANIIIVYKLSCSKTYLVIGIQDAILYTMYAI